MPPKRRAAPGKGRKAPAKKAKAAAAKRNVAADNDVPEEADQVAVAKSMFYPFDLPASS